ncbi:MAG: hypothetical protein ACRDWA_08640 [Acidimicrobiia bacterium]
MNLYLGFLFLGACGGSFEPVTTTTGSATDGGETTASSTGVVENPCDLVAPETVASVFGATSASGEPGIARNCTFTMAGGVAPSVEVFDYGAASDWDGIRAGFEDNRGGTTDIPGLGDEAFQPNDVGPYELVVRAGEIVFSVAVQVGSGGHEVEAALVELAGAIAG